MSSPTETKAQRVERLKREKNPWESLEELRSFAPKGFAAIPAEWLGTYLRWWGVYTQGDGSGVVGGRNGEGRAAPYFMVRIRITNGLLRADQVRTIASLAEAYGRGGADLTVRQNVQLHWVAIENLPEILESLWSAGLTTTGSCGDDTRNITGCPLAGIDPSELIDASPLAEQATRMLVGDAGFYNLPRKFKVTITGCPEWCSYPEINDIGFTAIRRGDETGFSMRVGGGLSADPHLALRLNAFLRWEQVLPALRAAACIFRDADALRDHRDRARLKHLFLRQHWTADRFLDELRRRVSFPIEEAAREFPPADVFRDHTGIHRQQQEGYSYVGASVLRGRVTAEQLRLAAGVADSFGNGELRTTIGQNLLLANIPTRDTEEVARELSDSGLPVRASPFARGTVACTGSQYCKLGITETKAFAQWLVEELDARLPGFEEQLKINITGCPNSCGQHWIADIGIEGKKLSTGGTIVDAYYFCVGGAVGQHAAIARPVGYRCAASEVPDAIERLLRAWRMQSATGEPLRTFLSRHSDDALRSILAGGAVDLSLRDPSPGRPPHGLDL